MRFSASAEPAPKSACSPFLSRTLGGIVLLFGGVLLVAMAALELPWPQQALLAILSLLFGIVADRLSDTHLVTLLLTLLSCFSTLRYALWRLNTIR